jgi:GAF domain-containing protein
VVENDRNRTLAASHDTLGMADKLQEELQEGPCFEALRRQETTLSDDVAHDDRWRTWGARVVEETGLCSLLSFRLFTSEDSAGVLSLYATRPSAFDHDDLMEGQVVAVHASVALATNLKERQLHQALERRTVIGQATGILIERFGLSPDQAFAVMRRVSQQHNVKVHDLAAHLVETGVLLDPWADGRAGPRDQEPESR